MGVCVLALLKHILQWSVTFKEGYDETEQQATCEP